MVHFPLNEQNILSLKNTEIDEWLISEMALFENGRDGNAQFQHPNCPFVQAVNIQWKLIDGRYVNLLNYQDDYCFGISANYYEEPVLKHEAYVDSKSIYRISDGSNFPIGKVSNISFSHDEYQNVTSISIVINNVEILLKAGEVMEDWNETYIIHEMDSAILLFRHPELLNKITFGEKQNI
jgi:hypothetical protein